MSLGEKAILTKYSKTLEFTINMRNETLRKSDVYHFYESERIEVKCIGQPVKLFPLWAKEKVETADKRGGMT